SVEFVPMMWGKDDVTKDLPASAKFLLGFNEPNFFAQANLSAQDAADLWPQVEAKAKAAGVPIVSPALNFCGPADQCHGTDPYQYLKDFFAACSDCQVDAVAVHWYNCDLPSLKDYLEPGGNLEGFEQFGRPIWLTEFSCNGDASTAEQETFMREAIPYLEENSHVFRYAWFSAGPIPNAKLIADDGSPTALGRVYMGLDQACRQ
ncbi:MAG TPA: glycoside hydrolase family protein, partial [Polyangiaceae bacterium]|nr:glycoside hydrolase family protein [Polyangiaceae bacterium]